MSSANVFHLESLKMVLFGNKLNTSPNNNLLNWSNLKAFADDEINANEIMKFGFGGAENTVGKGENAVYQHFFLFQQCFQKASFSRSLKVRIVWL